MGFVWVNPAICNVNVHKPVPVHSLHSTGPWPRAVKQENFRNQLQKKKIKKKKEKKKEKVVSVVSNNLVEILIKK